MKKVLQAMILGCLCYAAPAKSQILVDTALVRAPSDINLGPSLSLSKIKYENEENNKTFTIKRNTLGLGLVCKLDSSVDFLMQLGYTFDEKFENSALDEGTGYMAGMGINFAMYHGKKIDIVGYGLLNYITDHYKKDYVTVDMHLTDAHLGSLLIFKASPVVGIFGGLDLVPYSEGSIDHHSGNVDFKRNELLNFKLGLEFNLPGVVIKPEATLGGENTFSLIATFAIN